VKKVYLIGLAVASLFLVPSKLHAYNGMWDDSQLVTYKITVPSATTSTTAVVVDLSDIVNFPHKRSKELILTSIALQIDKVAASTCTVKLGVVNFVNASTGSVTWFTEFPNDRNVSNTLTQNYYTGTYYYDLLVKPSSTSDVDGATPYILSNDKTSGSTTYQNDVVLPNAANTSATPAVGDLIMQVTKDATNALDVYVTVTYFAE
jgi:hypothetical protein